MNKKEIIEFVPIDGKLYISLENANKSIDIMQKRIEKQKEVIDKAIEKINDYKIYCEENKGFTEYTDIEIEAIEPVISRLEDILKEVSE